MLSMTSDYATSHGCPGPYLQRIAETGFTHVHWCHQWDSDFLYADSEIEQIARWLSEFALGVTDLHASAGQEKGWVSRREYERLAGIELVANRLAMAARLGADVIILHLPGAPAAPELRSAFWDRVWDSLDALRRPAARHGVRIAIENGNFDDIGEVLARYDEAYLGLCYDSGHGNLLRDGLDRLEGLKDRLISIHLHDNDGRSDLHRIPFTGTVDWPRLAAILAASSYAKWVSLECTTANSDVEDEAAYLGQAHAAGAGLAEMIARAARA